MRRSRALLLSLSAALASCSVLDPAFTAATPGPSGRPPVEVTVDIEGNTAFSATDLRLRIEDYLLDLSRDPGRESSVYDAAIEVEEHYHGNGYPVTRVEYEYAPPGDDAAWPASVRVLLRVIEGPLVTVDLHLHGNAAHAHAELRELWQRRRAGTLGLGGDVFVEADLRSFATNIDTFYRSRGRLDAVVHEPVIAVDLETAVATVAITIDEGHVHTIAAVVLDEPLRAALGDGHPPSPIGRPAAPDEVDAWRAALRDALRARGHADPRIEVVAERSDVAPFAMQLRATGEPGPTATIASIRLTGNERTLDGTILGRIDLVPGQRYDGREVDDSLRRLYRTGLFRRVELRELPVDGDPQRLAMAVEVEELDSRSAEFLVGYGSYEQLRGGIRLEERNLFGTGRLVALDTRASLKGHSVGLSITDPDFLQTQTTLSLSGEFFQRQEPSFTDEAVGGTMAFTRQLAHGLSARTGYTFRERTDPIARTVLPEDRLVDFIEGRVFVELQNDRRDSVLFPRSGHAEFVSFERLSPTFGANVDLDRLTLRAARYFGVFGSLGLAMRGELGVVWPHDGSANVPLQERWYNGGENSVRSFRESRLGPRDANDNPVGGEYRTVFGLELRAPVWRTLEGALFVDVGNTGSEIQDLSLDDLGWGLGAGVRWLLPIGPVRCDAAWNPDRRAGDEEWELHVSVGYPF